VVERSLRGDLMQCVIEVPYEKQRLIDKKAGILQILAMNRDPMRRPWYRMKLEAVNKEIREYNRRH